MKFKKNKSQTCSIVGGHPRSSINEFDDNEHFPSNHIQDLLSYFRLPTHDRHVS